jgi:hypothetical protein
MTIPQDEWIHRCDSFPVEVILNGRSYYSPQGEMPVASFYFWQNGVRVKYYEYGLTQNGDDMDTLHLALTRVEPGVPAGLYPLVSDITYQLVNQTMSASCGSNPDTLANATTLCMDGSFNDDQFLSFTTNDTRTNTITTLRAVDKQWKFAFDAPSFELKEVQHDNSLGNIALQTAVTERGHCNALKICSSGTGIDVLAPVGLTLLQQGKYGAVCTMPSSRLAIRKILPVAMFAR